MTRVCLALFQPDIPQNTGTLIRLAACMDADIHIIHPTGFTFSDRHLRRAGMDYASEARLTEHDSYETFASWRAKAGRRLVLLTTKAADSVYDVQFKENDVLMLGRESAGVPDKVAADADTRVRIPMAEGMRSLNVALSGAIALGEALRQTNTLPIA